MTKIFTTLLALLVALATGCSDDDSGGAAVDAGGDTNRSGAFAPYVGFWRMNSMTLELGTGPITVTRGGSPISLVGDVTLAVVDDTQAEIVVRMIGLQDGLIAEPVEAERFMVESDAGDWLIDTDDISVFRPILQGDTLTMTRLTDDPRGTAESSDGPQEIILERADEPAGLAVGTWDMVSADAPDGSGSTIAGACTENDGTYTAFFFTISIDEDYLVSLDSEDVEYADAACENEVATDPSSQVGAAEEIGDTLHVWLLDPDDELNNQYIEFTMSESGGQLTLTRESCLPSSDCEEGIPTAMVLEPAQ